MNENPHNKLKVRRFLLGELSESERTEFEENFIADENLYEQIRVVEDELIENYVRGNLKAAARATFEKNFLTTATRREHTAFTRAMLGQFQKRKYNRK